MSVDEQTRLDSFRRAAGQFASGVTVVTTAHDDHLYGITATSFVSLSLNPLLVTVSINLHSPILEEIRASGVFAINVLGREQQAVSAYFARRGRGHSRERFDEVTTHVEMTGAPVVTGALSWFDCAVHTMLDGGDHVILVGEVRAAGGGTGEPLLYWSGTYRELSAEEAAAAEAVAKADDIHRIADSLSAQLHMHGMTTAQLLEAQRAIEPVAAAMAAREATDEQIAELRALVEHAETLHDDVDQYNPIALDFHARLGMLSANPAIATSVRALTQPRVSVYSEHTTSQRALRATEAHRGILDAIAQHDEERARRLMAEHLRSVEHGVSA